MPRVRQQRQASVERHSPVPVLSSTFRAMNKMLRRSIGLINQKISQLEVKINTAASSPVQSDPDPDMSQQGDLSNPSQKICYVNVSQSINVEKPRFPGSKKSRPVTFIEDLTSWLKKTPVNNNEVDLIIECLEGETRDWARIYKDRWTGLQDFKRDFLNTYCEAEQNELRRKIVCSEWDKEREPTMLGHFISLTAQAKMLSYPIPEKQLIGDIMRHFPREVQYAWASQPVVNTLEATEFLRRLDDINKLKTHSTTKSIQKPQPFSGGNKVYQGSNGKGFQRQNRPSTSNSTRPGIPAAALPERRANNINLLESPEQIVIEDNAQNLN
ncbi:hypothetical protein NE865_03230 [Phthorimaea operculella]|nr:hypothetical protein NE865_03230 [Phthorimaea operculella]